MPMPNTLHNMNPFDCLSLMQKAVRRNMPELAFKAAVELIHTSKAYNKMVANRLIVIALEDIDSIADQTILPYVKACAELMEQFYTTDVMKLGKVKMAACGAIRVMSRAQKCRINDDMITTIGLANLLDGETFEIPDWALDGHTLAGKRKGRGVDFFAQESTKLVPAPKRKNKYVDQSLEYKKRKKAGEKPYHEKNDLFD